MGDIGIKVALTEDGLNSPDELLAFSSSWPTLKMVTIGRYWMGGVYDANGFFKIYEHNLGFVPFVISYQLFSGNINPMYNATGLTYFDNQAIYFAGGGSQGTSGVSGSPIIVFALDIEKPYKAPQVKTMGSAHGLVTSDYGLKIAKEGKTIKSKDMRDFVMHSNTRTPLVHSVNVGVCGADNTVTFYHDLPYNPLFYVFMKRSTSSNKYFSLYSNQITTSGNSIQVYDAPGTQVSVVILKDSFDIEDNIVSINV